jgi:hypothetical protein
VFHGLDDWCSLLALVFVVNFGGLITISLLSQPALIARYALPASLPMVLLPLVVAWRLDRRGPLILTVVGLMGSAPLVATRFQGMELGFAELAAFLDDHVDPNSAVVALAVDGSADELWLEMERAALDYYPLERVSVSQLAVAPVQEVDRMSILRDPRAIYVIVFRVDPTDAIRAAGRRLEGIVLDGTVYDKLLFTPYRLLRVAPMGGA